ncbi:hypothetical protein PGTUg99_003873 [Puccinia graminis f. sp. tritici]|uniref:Uncharacterized protein n=1 Tax=Puccinia graminis f. sp. tritici TaxID=56615 RepID=A0A5B0PRU4_PUCGR|nr:hypothetical protein PGTUg99_003873 [Puccinia graminis f. sp. tritici]
MIMRSKFSLLGYSTVCLFAFGIALARPALLDSDSESLFATDRNSNTGDLFEVFNRGSLLGQKRLQELQSEPCQQAQSGVEVHCAHFGNRNEFKDAGPRDKKQCRLLTMAPVPILASGLNPPLTLFLIGRS